MKNLNATIPMANELVESFVNEEVLAGYGVTVTKEAYSQELTSVVVQVPQDRVSDIANIEGETPGLLADLRQAAKKHLAK